MVSLNLVQIPKSLPMRDNQAAEKPNNAWSWWRRDAWTPRVKEGSGGTTAEKWQKLMK